MDLLSEKDHQRVACYIEEIAGIQLPPAKRTLVETRLRKRQKTLNYPTLKGYISFVLDSPEGRHEQIYMLDALTTNKTDFYREPIHFSFLQEHIQKKLAPLRQQGWTKPLRIWSAGCSSGEEPYTLAMEMMEIRRLMPGFQFHIDATDISISSLQTAKRGTYPHSRIEPVPMALRKRYLMRHRNPNEHKVKMAPEIAEKIDFKLFNLLTDSFKFRDLYDVIFCRNVMIYFNQNDRAKIFQHFAKSLTQGGLLFIGHSETLIDDDDNYSQCMPTVYQKGNNV